MPETDQTRNAAGAWLRLRHGLGTKLIALLTAALIVIFAVLAISKRLPSSAPNA